MPARHPNPQPKSRAPSLQVSKLFRKTHDRTIHVAEVDHLAIGDAIEATQSSFQPPRSLRLTRQPGFLFGLAVGYNQLGPGVFIAEAAEDGICFMQVCYSPSRHLNSVAFLRICTCCVIYAPPPHTCPRRG